MPTKAILLTAQDLSDRPKDPPPLAAMQEEMKEYCKRNSYTIIAKIGTQQKFAYERNTPLTKMILESATGADDIVIVLLGKIYAQIEGDTIDSELAKLVSEGRLRIEPIEHPCVAPPNDGNTCIWRYLSLPKFVDLLQSSSLHFSRVDEMRKFDASEGVSSTRAMKRLIQDVRESKVPSPVPQLTREQFLQGFDRSTPDELLSKVNFVSCWHMSEHENFAMWKVYSEPFGVCIESRYDDLKNCFTDQKWDYYANRNKIHIGKVEYIDGETQFIRLDNTFWTFLSKRREYSYENELRCIAMDWEQPLFVRPRVDLGKLIRKIGLSPEAPSWYRATVVDLCRRYGLDKELIVGSALSDN